MSPTYLAEREAAHLRYTYDRLFSELAGAP